MTIRTTMKTVTFTRPLVLGAFDEVQPAGDYIVETDEELLEGMISVPAYRRLSAVIYLHATPGNPGRTQALTTNPNELDAALSRDQAPARTTADSRSMDHADRYWPRFSRQETGTSAIC